MERTTGAGIVYLHGFPGGPGELRLFGPPPDWAATAFVPDRTADRPALDDAAYIDDLARQVAERFPGRALYLIGFSLGARVALELALRLGPTVARIDLISPAGPLDGSDLMRQMAGGPVFDLAARSPRLFALHSRIQGWLARHWPGLLIRLLFATAGPGDAGPAADPGFQAVMAVLLRHCFADGGSGYRREIRAYVDLWSDLPGRITAPVTMWQGEQDRWTPPALAERLAGLLLHVRLNRLPDAGHYATLSQVLPHLAAGPDRQAVGQ